MNNTEQTAEIIDITPENIVEHSPEPAAAKSASRSLVPRLGLVAGIALLSAVGGGWFYRDVLSSYLPSDQVRLMAARMDGLEATAKTLNSKVDAVVGFTDEIKSQLAAAQASAAIIPQLQTDSADSKGNILALQNSLRAASLSLETLKTQFASVGPATGGGDNSGLVARLETVEKDIASLKQSEGNSSDLTVLSQSLADLKAKLVAGAAYKNEFDRIKLMVPAAEGLDVLQVHAENGLPNSQGLSAELKSLLAAVPQAAMSPRAPDDSWWSYATNLASGLITIKPDGASDWVQIANQSVLLAEQGDLAGAIAALDKTEGALPVELQSWHDRAMARLALEKALEQTSAAVLRQLAAKG
jgi:hypothetical protein